jgi:hypothetical protein
MPPPMQHLGLSARFRRCAAALLAASGVVQAWRCMVSGSLRLQHHVHNHFGPDARAVFNSVKPFLLQQGQGQGHGEVVALGMKHAARPSERIGFDGFPTPSSPEPLSVPVHDRIENQVPKKLWESGPASSRRRFADSNGVEPF